MVRQIHQENYAVHGLNQRTASFSRVKIKEEEEEEQNTVRRWPRPTANAMT